MYKVRETNRQTHKYTDIWSEKNKKKTNTLKLFRQFLHFHVYVFVRVYIFIDVCKQKTVCLFLSTHHPGSEK